MLISWISVFPVVCFESFRSLAGISSYPTATSGLIRSISLIMFLTICSTVVLWRVFLHYQNGFNFTTDLWTLFRKFLLFFLRCLIFDMLIIKTLYELIHVLNFLLSVIKVCFFSLKALSTMCLVLKKAFMCLLKNECKSFLY